MLAGGALNPARVHRALQRTVQVRAHCGQFFSRKGLLYRLEQLPLFLADVRGKQFPKLL